jgi:hypothetical protein
VLSEAALCIMNLDGLPRAKITLESAGLVAKGLEDLLGADALHWTTSRCRGA